MSSEKTTENNNRYGATGRTLTPTIHWKTISRESPRRLPKMALKTPIEAASDKKIIITVLS
ncbi:MAG TPA: hypothetical protein VIG62_01395, partial [Blastocatellia bacterium]